MGLELSRTYLITPGLIAGGIDIWRDYHVRLN